jgi:hypothetical protein
MTCRLFSRREDKAPDYLRTCASGGEDHQDHKGVILQEDGGQERQVRAGRQY